MKLKCDDFVQKFKSELPEQRILLDVRNDDEVAQGFLGGCSHIPLGQLEKRCHEINSSKNIFVYCKAGGRAQKAADILSQAGFKMVYAAVECGYEELKSKIY